MAAAVKHHRDDINDKQAKKSPPPLYEEERDDVPSSSRQLHSNNSISTNGVFRTRASSSNNALQTLPDHPFLKRIRRISTFSFEDGEVQMLRNMANTSDTSIDQDEDHQFRKKRCNRGLDCSPSQGGPTGEFFFKPNHDHSTPRKVSILENRLNLPDEFMATMFQSPDCDFVDPIPFNALSQHTASFQPNNVAPPNEYQDTFERDLPSLSASNSQDLGGDSWQQLDLKDDAVQVPSFDTLPPVSSYSDETSSNPAYNMCMNVLRVYAPYEEAMKPILQLILFLLDDMDTNDNKAWQAVGALQAEFKTSERRPTTDSKAIAASIFESLVEIWGREFGEIFMASQPYESVQLDNLIGSKTAFASPQSKTSMAVLYGIHALKLYPEADSVIDVVQRSVKHLESMNAKQCNELWQDVVSTPVAKAKLDVDRTAFV